MPDLQKRLAAIDWPAAGTALDARGYAVLPGLLAAADCKSLIALYGDDAQFRKRIVMQSHGYGRGEYKYFLIPCRRWWRICVMRCILPLSPIAGTKR